MVKLIVGKRGTGKTKTLIDLVTERADQSKGNVVCIEKGDSLKFDLNPKIRLIDIEEYNISGPDAYYGFISGLLAGNYDITDICCDATFRIICGFDCKDPEVLEGFILRIEELVKTHECSIVFTVSANTEDIPKSLHKFINVQE